MASSSWPVTKLYNPRFPRYICFTLSGTVGRRDQITNVVHLREPTGNVHVKILVFEIGVTLISHRNKWV
jgi:hypothetical protein